MMRDPGLAHQTQFSFPSLFCTMEPEPVQPGMLINVCKYLDSLQYRVWKKMVMSVETGEWGRGQVVQAWEALHARQRARSTHFLQPHSDRAQHPAPPPLVAPLLKCLLAGRLPLWVLTFGHLLRKRN